MHPRLFLILLLLLTLPSAWARVLVSELAADAPAMESAWPLFDGGGNVRGLVNRDGGARLAEYEYDAFGQAVRQVTPNANFGDVALLNPFRHATKSTDDETGLAYYGYRYYHPGQGRWLGRDPIGENGGFNLYVKVGNNSLNQVDPYGQTGWPLSPPQIYWDKDLAGMMRSPEYIKGFNKTVATGIQVGTGAIVGLAGGWVAAGFVAEFFGAGLIAQGIAAGFAGDLAVQSMEIAYGDREEIDLGRAGWGGLTGGGAVAAANAGKAIASAGTGPLGQTMRLTCQEQRELAAAAAKLDVGVRLTTVDDVLRNPNLLAGKGPAEIQAILGRTPGWQIETLGKGSHAGEGWVLREYTAADHATGRMIRWHPGGGHHGPSPYWRVTGGVDGKSGIIPGVPE